MTRAPATWLAVATLCLLVLGESAALVVLVLR